ncbi:translation initiation factor IF-2 [Rubritalea marina]|uniref:translation initiation factor IF-2 n=1 Tax=Rubritalea marina TaxID=361055 RepID=UPI00037573C2|nr:translation initiation factor IF-2 [Rubritalea marina]
MADQKDNKNEKKEVLDLLDDSKSKKPSRRERQRQEASKVKTLDDKKAEALDIFDDGGKKKTSVVKKGKGNAALPSISKLNETAEEAPSNGPEEAAPAPVEEVPAAPVVSDGKVIHIKPPIIVSDLADLMDLKPFQLMADLIKLQVFVAPNQAIDPEVAEKLCQQHGFEFEREKREKGAGVHKVEEVFLEPEPEEDVPEDKLELRAPIITFMGHVDHGKTSLLDAVRDSRVAAGEAGGITQHIGAYGVKDSEGRPITLLDTPGHAIFSKMRARGADITDIVVLVVAADDGIMPQTKEAIDHAKAAEKTIIVAINKCDVPGADPTRVRTQLMEHSLTPVDFGGDVECVDVSAKTGDGMEDLLELLALQAEVLELRANPNANARASVIEARVQPGKGPTATVIVESGTLKVGMPFICGPFNGKIKSMLDDHGNSMKKAGPATPVEVLGFSELPNVGDAMVEMDSERAAKKLAAERQGTKRSERLGGAQKSRLDDFMAMAKGDAQKARLQLILKTDVQGSVGAITGAIEDIESQKVEARFIHSAAGSITESDILLASSANAIVLGFNTKVESRAVQAAKREGVEIKLYSVVYELIDTVNDAMLGLLEPETRETIIGHAEVKQVFKVNKGKAAGCIVKDGKVTRVAHARVLRGGTPVFDGKMSTLRRFHDEVKEVKQGIECGIKLGDFNDYEEGDVIQCYNLEKVEQTL